MQTPVFAHTHAAASATYFIYLFILPFIQYFLSHLYSLYCFLSSSLSLPLFPSPLGFLVIPLNHYRGPSLFIGLSHPSLRPRLPSVSLFSRFLSPARLSMSSLSISKVENEQQ